MNIFDIAKEMCVGPNPAANGSGALNRNQTQPPK